LNQERRRALLGIAILLIVGTALALYSFKLESLYEGLFKLRASNDPLIYLSFAFLLVLAFLTSIFPASIFGVLAGALFGFTKGFAISAVSLLTAALIAFVFARYFFRTVIRRIAARVFDLDRLETRLSKYGWRYALLIRSAPIAPFGITSYGLSLTPLKLSAYMLTTLATIPFLLTCVYLGSAGEILVRQGSEIDRSALFRLAVLFSAITIALAIITKLLSKLARRFLPNDVASPNGQVPRGSLPVPTIRRRSHDDLLA
jgi:uncharacterized membrane protein YdjX (TVP38/TMEM64 family)